MDEYWPGSTIVKCIRRDFDSLVYIATYDGLDTIVKAVKNRAFLMGKTQDRMTFVNYIG